MKIWPAAFLALIIPFKGFTLPVGNPKEADFLLDGLILGPTCNCCSLCDWYWNIWDTSSLRAGYWGHFVFNRDLKVDRKIASESKRRKLEKAEIFTNAGYIAWNFCNRADLFATFGLTDMHLGFDSSALGAPFSFRSRLDFSPAFSWSLGARMTLWEVEPLAMGIEGQFFSACPWLDQFVNASTGEIFHFDGHHASYREWQVGLGLSCTICACCCHACLIPFGAIKYSNAHLDLDDLAFSTTLFETSTLLGLQNVQSRKPWGAAIGISLTSGGRTAITVEADFGDEKALHVNGQIRF